MIISNLVEMTLRDVESLRNALLKGEYSNAKRIARAIAENCEELETAELYSYDEFEPWYNR